MGSIVMTEIKVDNIVDVAGTGKPNFPVAPTHSTGSALNTLNVYKYDTTTRVVTVVDDGGNKFAIDGVTAPTITLLRGVTYTFDVSDSSVSTHPLAFKNGGVSYTTGVTSTGTAGTAGATVTFAVDAAAPLTGLTYYCTTHGDGMGSSVTTSDPTNGTLLWDGAVKFYADSAFRDVGGSGGSGGSSSGIAWGGARGIWSGGSNNAAVRVDTIQYAAIATPGNTSDFGDLTASREWSAACSNGSRSIVAGGYDAATSGSTNIIDYFATATTGNATDFGNLLLADRFKGACSDGASNTGRGLIGGGYAGSQKAIDYVVIANTGNSSDFGDLTINRYYITAAASATRGVFMGGIGSSLADETNVIDYVTISTAGNATDFGDLAQIVRGGAASSDTTRILFSGGYANNTARVNTIQYITTATAGNATDFGDATVNVERHGACSDGTYHVNGGGTSDGSPARVNVMDYVTIQTLGNAQDFGDLLFITSGVSASSGAAA